MMKVVTQTTGCVTVLSCAKTDGIRMSPLLLDLMEAYACRPRPRGNTCVRPMRRAPIVQSHCSHLLIQPARVSNLDQLSSSARCNGEVRGQQFMTRARGDRL